MNIYDTSTSTAGAKINLHDSSIGIGDYVAYSSSSHTFKGKNKDIWKVKSFTESGQVYLDSIIRPNKGFDTHISNLILISDLIVNGHFDPQYFKPDSYTAFMQLNNVKITESKKMNSTNDMVKRTMNTNTQAAKVAATITAGKTLNTLVANKVVPQLPLMVKGYADTALGRVVIANIADFAVKQFMPGNTKANMASNAMMQAAMLELADSFDLESIVAELVDSVAIPEVD